MGMGGNVGAFVYYFSELGMESWYVNNTCEWRGRACSDSCDVQQELNGGRDE